MGKVVSLDRIKNVPNEKNAYLEIKENKTLRNLTAFMKNYPESEKIDEINEMLKIVGKGHFIVASEEKSEKGLNEYLEYLPNGEDALIAKELLKQFLSPEDKLILLMDEACSWEMAVKDATEIKKKIKKDSNFKKENLKQWRIKMRELDKRVLSAKKRFNKLNRDYLNMTGKKWSKRDSNCQ